MNFHDDINTEVMYYGKYTGYKFCDIPKDYLRWAMNHMDCLPYGSKLLIQKYLGETSSAKST